MPRGRFPCVSMPSLDALPLRVALLISLAWGLSGCFSTATTAVAVGATVVAQERSVGDAVDDLTIRTTLNKLFLDESFGLYNSVSFSVVEGRVLLKGAVEQPDHRIKATQLTWRAAGVREVINEIQVTDQGGIVDYAKDTWISTQLKSKMMFAADVLSINYSVETVNGTIYLMGIAQDQKEIDKVIALARDVPDVVEVVSHVVTKGDRSRVKKP